MVGLVISAHVFGMYALSPITGRLTDRFGSVPVIYAGMAVLAGAALLGAIAPADGGAILFLAGRAAMRSAGGVEQTQATVKEDVQWAKQQIAR